jgi:hypothetical protein
MSLPTFEVISLIIESVTLVLVLVRPWGRRP